MTHHARLIEIESEYLLTEAGRAAHYETRKEFWVTEDAEGEKYFDISTDYCIDAPNIMAAGSSLRIGGCFRQSIYSRDLDQY